MLTDLGVSNITNIKNVSDLAHAFSQAIPLNVVTIKDVIKWADSLIEIEDEPSVVIIDLALCVTCSEAVTLLNALSVGFDEKRAMRIFFGLCYEALRNEVVDYPVVAKRLFFWSAYETTLEGFGELVSYWDELDIADAGVYGDSQEIKSRLLAFLDVNKLELKSI